MSNSYEYLYDSPPDVNIDLNVNANCVWLPTPFDPVNDANGDPYNPDEKNIMSYSTPECKEYFTQVRQIECLI